MGTEKQKCGGGGIDPDYDLPLHIGAVFIVLFASIIGCGFPVVAKKVPWLKIPPRVFFVTKHFGTGVLIATAFVHLVPTAFASLNDPCLPDLFNDKYPALPGVIMMTSLLMLFCVELYINTKVGGHSHGGATGEGLFNNATPMGHGGHGHHVPQGSISGPFPAAPPYRSDSPYPDEKADAIRDNPFADSDDDLPHHTQSEMPAWFVAFYIQYVRQRDELREALTRVAPNAISSGHSRHAPQRNTPEPSGDVENQTVDPQVLRKMNMNITLLEGGILFHSIFVGMTISIESEGFIVLLVAIIFHQFFEGLGLGSRIASVPYPKKSIRPWVLVFAFGATCPLGQVIGLITRTSYDPSSAFALILVGSFNAFSSGLLIYAACVDLLAEDFLSEEGMALSKKQKISGLVYVFLGAIGMAIVGAFA